MLRLLQKLCTAVALRRQKKKGEKKADNLSAGGLIRFQNVNKAVSQLQPPAQYVNTTNKPISASHHGWQRSEAIKLLAAF